MSENERLREALSGRDDEDFQCAEDMLRDEMGDALGDYGQSPYETALRCVRAVRAALAGEGEEPERPEPGTWWVGSDGMKIYEETEDDYRFIGTAQLPQDAQRIVDAVNDSPTPASPGEESAEEKFQAIRCLDPEAHITLSITNSPRWYVESRLGIVDDGFLQGVAGYADTPEMAVGNVWEKITAPGVVVAVGKRRVSWRGYMWWEEQKGEAVADPEEKEEGCSAEYLRGYDDALQATTGISLSRALEGERQCREGKTITLDELKAQVRKQVEAMPKWQRDAHAHLSGVKQEGQACPDLSTEPGMELAQRQCDLADALGVDRGTPWFPMLEKVARLGNLPPTSGAIDALRTEDAQEGSE